MILNYTLLFSISIRFASEIHPIVFGLLIGLARKLRMNLIEQRNVKKVLDWSTYSSFFVYI
jgi:hypothetical protein